MSRDSLKKEGLNYRYFALFSRHGNLDYHWTNIIKRRIFDVRNGIGFLP